MNFHRLLALFGVAAVLAAPAGGQEERNAWPVRVTQTAADGHVTSWSAGGPFFFAQTDEDGQTVTGFRPWFVRWTQAGDAKTEATVLYPLYLYRADSEVYQWSILQLINRSGRTPGAVPSADTTEAFDVWPFWFSRRTDSPATSYSALFPVAGTIKNRFGFDRVAWTLWPLYVQSESHGATTTSTPWPFLRVTCGTEQGFALWPLIGWREKPGKFRRAYWLWPLLWHNTTAPDAAAPAGTKPSEQVGILPFYTREQSPGFVNENFLWPFFGYTDRTAAPRYHETRYLWPFLVQGRGPGRYVNRWGPFYTHSVIKGVDKVWAPWPLVREERWTDDGLVQTKTQFFYFLYWSLEQRSATHPALPAARKTHLWPLFSDWDNGAGRRQFELFSPFEVFFTDNREVRQTWTPFFALFRYDRRAPGHERVSVLWDALTWRRAPGRTEFNLGPLFGFRSGPERTRLALGRGLVGLQRQRGKAGWRFFWFDFPPKPDHPDLKSR